MSIVRKIASFIYPPIDLLGVNNSLIGAPEKFKDTIDKNFKNNKYSEEQAKDVFEWAKIIYQSEAERKETIENKAQSYLVGLSIATGIIAVIPFLFSERWSLPNNFAVLVAILFTAAVFYMITAGFFSLKTRQGGAFNLPGADLFSQQSKENSIEHLKNSSLLILFAKNNEAILTEKSNYLYVAEMSFVRAILLIMMSIILAVSGKLYASPIETTKKSIQAINIKLDTLKKEFDSNKIELDKQSKELNSLRQAGKNVEEELMHMQEKVSLCESEGKQDIVEAFEKFIIVNCTWTHKVRPPFRDAPLFPSFMGR